MSMRDITSIAVHCAYTPPSMDVGAERIARWHRARGFSDIGYHFVIRRGGQVETGRALERPGAHVGGHNAHSIGVCLAGGKAENYDRPEMNFTEAQMSALRSLLFELRQRFPRAAVMGHCDYPGVSKPCPCFDVQAWWNGKAATDSGNMPEQDFWPGIDHFVPREFDQPMHPSFIRLLEQARKAAGVPFVVERTISGREALIRIKL